MALLKDLEDHMLKPSIVVINAIISACGAATEWRQALQQFVEARGRVLNPDVVTYAAAMSSVEKTNQWQRALSLLEEVGHQRVKTNIIVLNAAVSACGGAAQWQVAVQILSEVHARLLQTDLVTYDAVLSACANGMEWQKVIALLRTLQETDIQLGVIAFNAAITACERASQWQAAIHLLEIAGTVVDLTVVTFSATISACEQSGRWVEAVHLLRCMEQRHLEANLISYASVISSCEKALRWREALAILNNSLRKWLQPNTIASGGALRACSRSMHWEAVLDVLQMMQKHTELDSRSTELHKVFEHKLALLHEDWEAQARSMQQAQSSSLWKEYTFLVHAESTGLREECELVGANTALRAEIASSQEKQLSDSREALKAAEADLKELKATFAAAAARSEDEKAAQAKIWSEVGGFRKELAKLDGQMQQLRQQQSAARPAGGEKPLGESEVRRLVVRTNRSCEIALRPVHHRIDVAMSEVAKAKAAASEESKRARQELAGQLRAETEEVATNAASKARRSLDAEMRNVVDALRRQLLEAMETNSLRATQQFKESSASHNTEVRMLLDQLEDVRRFTHELSLSVRELQAKALDTGAQMRSGDRDRVLLQLQELAGHMRLTSGKIRDLQELTGHLQARTADHTTRLQSLTGEAVAGNQRLETLAVLLETANVRLDRAEGVFSGMEMLGRVGGWQDVDVALRAMPVLVRSLIACSGLLTRLQDVDTNMEKFFRGITALDARVDGVEAQATMPSRIVEAEEEASAPRANELEGLLGLGLGFIDSPPWNAAVRGMENLTQIVGSLERSEGTPEPLVGVALREEVKEGFEEVWKAVRELQFRCAVPPRRPSLASETEQLQGAMPQEEQDRGFGSPL
eukprot:s1938_g5.t1